MGEERRGETEKDGETETERRRRGERGRHRGLFEVTPSVLSTRNILAFDQVPRGPAIFPGGLSDYQGLPACRKKHGCVFPLVRAPAPTVGRGFPSGQTEGAEEEGDEAVTVVGDKSL